MGLDTKKYYKLKQQLSEMGNPDIGTIFSIVIYNYPTESDITIYREGKEYTNPTDAEMAFLYPKGRAVTRINVETEEAYSEEY